MARVPPETPCVMCLAPAKKQCSGCHGFWYCGVECQRKHWRTHKMDCGRVKELQNMTPKKLLADLEEKEREFQVVSDIVRKHRETTDCKMVWVTRSGSALREDMEDARLLPGIKEKLDVFDQNPKDHQTACISTLFSATEGVASAKSAAFFEQVKPLKEQLQGMAMKDEESGTETIIRCGGQQLPAAAARACTLDDLVGGTCEIAGGTAAVNALMGIPAPPPAEAPDAAAPPKAEEEEQEAPAAPSLAPIAAAAAMEKSGMLEVD